MIFVRHTHIVLVAFGAAGVAAGLQETQLHSGGPREGGKQCQLLQRRRQALPHIGG